MKVKEILMTKAPNIFTVKPTDSIRRAAEHMAEHDIGLVMVVNEEGRLVGVVSERDIVHESIRREGLLYSLIVADIMTTNLIVATPEDELSYLINAMLEKRIRHLPVMDEEDLVGLISIRDIVQAMRAMYEGEIHHLRYYVADIEPEI